MATKYVYFFGNGDADGDESMRAELGGKGANLAQMAKAPLSLPVPPGFTITTDVCQEYYKLDRNYPEGLEAQVDEYLAKLEAAMGKKLGDENDPLLVSVRSGAAISMPGMMDTILNLGLNDKAVEGLAKKTGNEKFAYDAYRRFIQMYGDVAMGVDHDKFEAILEEVKEKAGVDSDQKLSVENLKEVVAKYKEMYKAEKGMTGIMTQELFEKYKVFDYLDTFYEVLHTTGTRYMVNDIDLYIKARQTAWFGWACVYRSSYGRIYKCAKRRIAIKIVLFIEKTVQFLRFSR